MRRAEGFLARWSRRKRLAAAPARDPAAGRSGAAPPDPPPPDAAPQPLPPVEAIDAAADVKPFLAPGVPDELTRRALRRAWSADPAIRDFIGLSENAWDFTAPGGVPGFASMAADEAQRLLAQATGAAGDAEPAPAAAHASAVPEPTPPPQLPVGGEEIPGSTNKIAADAAVHQKLDGEATVPTPTPHRHGGALPK